MRVYIFVIVRNTWNDDRQNSQQRGLTKLNNYNLLYLYYQNRNLIICLVPDNFNDEPQTICNQLEQDLKIENLTLNNFKVIYCQNHLPGVKWQNINSITTSSENMRVYRENIINNNIDFLNNLDPLIVIFTLRYSEVDYQEWHKAINSNKATFYDDNLNPIPQNNADKEKIRIAEFKVDNNYTVLFVKENDYKSDKGGINNLLSQILNQEQWKNFSKEDIYVAVHSLSDYAKNKDVYNFKNKFNDKVAYICDFHHYDQGIDKDFCDLLVKFLDVIDDDKKAEEKCEEIIKKIKELSKKNVNKFLNLQHKIKNIFLSLDIFLQDINYLNEILKEENEEKLTDLWYIVAKFQENKNNENNEKSNLLVEGEAIIDLIKEKIDDEYLTKYWGLLLKICGLKYSENNPFKIKGIDNESHILEFMKLLDSKKNKQSVEESDIKDIIGFFKNKNWKIEGADPEVIKSFHDWVSALGNCLEKIGEELKNEEEK
jgi:hypothetical protein